MTGPPRDRHIPDLVSLTEAAGIIGVSRQAAHKMATKGQLVGALVGGTWVFRRVVVQRMSKVSAEPTGTDNPPKRHDA